MVRTATALVAGACLVTAALTACSRSTAPPPTTAAPTPTTPASMTPTSTPAVATPVPGIESTLPDTVPPNALVCFPSPNGSGQPVTAQIADPAAPRVVSSIPDDWTSTPGTDPAATLAGPSNMSGSVTITATNQDPAPAFTDYLTALKRSHPGLAVDVQPAQFCGYSSQRLTGTFPNGTTTDQFTDRITHIWTNTGKYLVAIHVQAPDGTAGFDTAQSVATQDFSITIS